MPPTTVEMQWRNLPSRCLSYPSDAVARAKGEVGGQFQPLISLLRSMVGHFFCLVAGGHREKATYVRSGKGLSSFSRSLHSYKRRVDPTTKNMLAALNTWPKDREHLGINGLGFHRCSSEVGQNSPMDGQWIWLGARDFVWPTLVDLLAFPRVYRLSLFIMGEVRT